MKRVLTPLFFACRREVAPTDVLPLSLACLRGVQFVALPLAGGLRGLTREAGGSYSCLRLQGRRNSGKRSAEGLIVRLDVVRVTQRSVLLKDKLWETDGGRASGFRRQAMRILQFSSSPRGGALSRSIHAADLAPPSHSLHAADLRLRTRRRIPHPQQTNLVSSIRGQRQPRARSAREAYKNTEGPSALTGGIRDSR